MHASTKELPQTALSWKVYPPGASVPVSMTVSGPPGSLRSRRNTSGGSVRRALMNPLPASLPPVIDHCADRRYGTEAKVSKLTWKRMCAPASSSKSAEVSRE